jgi:hypothetical protein
VAAAENGAEHSTLGHWQQSALQMCVKKKTDACKIGACGAALAVWCSASPAYASVLVGPLAMRK